MLSALISSGDMMPNWIDLTRREGADEWAKLFILAGLRRGVEAGQVGIRNEESGG